MLRIVMSLSMAVDLCVKVEYEGKNLHKKNIQCDA